MRRAICIPLLLALAASAAEAPAVDISVEHWSGSEWRTVEPTTVFSANDQIRFRFSTTTPGYLYVLNRSSTGETEWIFPNQQTGRRNSVEPGQSYLVPATDGAFVIGGTPGFDITYWLVSPTPLSDWEHSLEPPPAKVEDTLLPRCREGVLKARGVCLDDRAGAGAVRDTGNVPKVFGEEPALRSRSLRFTGKGSSTRIQGRQNAPLLYEFRIAHR